MASKKPAVKSPKSTKATAKKKSPSKKAAKDTDPFALKRMTRTQLLEYRAVLAEWKVALGEGQLVGQKLNTEQQLPKHKELLDLMRLKTQTDDTTRERGVELQRVQVEIAKVLGITFEEFRTNYAIDLETGTVTNLT
jgi:hypothetical protein